MNDVRTITMVGEMQGAAERIRLGGKRLAIAPTMGCLHEGHLSLIRAARRNADVVITTIFVNPAQFGPGEDFERYPRNLERDTALAAGAGTDYIFAPAVRELYPEGYCTYVSVEDLSRLLEGKSRPGHFRGVATIVAKLFNIVKPHVAVFGQKDAQ
jgi:pantoate--beta-alanine ligase